MGKNFKIFLNVFGNFFEISLKFQSWHARAGTAQFGLDSWLAFSRSALGTRLRAILFSFLCTRLRPGGTRRELARLRHVFEEFCPAGLFLVERADSAAWPHRNRGTCGFTRDPAKSLSPPQRYISQKLLLGLQSETVSVFPTNCQVRK